MSGRSRSSDCSAGTVSRRAGACVIANGSGRAVAFSLVLGQAHELPQAVGLLARLPGVSR